MRSSSWACLVIFWLPRLCETIIFANCRYMISLSISFVSVGWFSNAWLYWTASVMNNYDPIRYGDYKINLFAKILKIFDNFKRNNFLTGKKLLQKLLQIELIDQNLKVSSLNNLSLYRGCGGIINWLNTNYWTTEKTTCASDNEWRCGRKVRVEKWNEYSARSLLSSSFLLKQW